MSTDAFTDEFTHSHGGGCFFVAALWTQIAEAATLVARSRPEADRQQFIAHLSSLAKDALPPSPQPNGDAEHDDVEPKKVQDTPETRERKRQVVAELVASLDNVRLEAQSDREFEGFANLVLSLVLGLYDAEEEQYAQLVRQLASALTFTESSSGLRANVNQSLAARYTSLATVFNSLPASATSLRLALFRSLVAFTAKNDDTSVVLPALKDSFVSWLLDEWKVESDLADEAVLEIVETLVSKGFTNEALALLRSYLAKTKSTSDSTARLAAKLVTLSLSANDLRLIKLAHVCADRVGQSVSYDEIAKAVGVEAGAAGDEGEEVETFVIDAIRASLLQGRLSQPTQTLYITRVSPTSSSFTAEQWKTVQARLEDWKGAVERIRGSVEKGLSGTAGRKEVSVGGTEE
ncbi:Proteophosphoglycan ppg4 [Rhodotorula toruloides ATCC 204091]|uniref:BY PROTMAP: gi/342321460/gb/EGU13393.1/ Proteophosphoglycan ppg4 [Rhodotorula glutinis ATCC 204091] n=1 Tax=Rhodotorula toruloides TaxID=5286 RepID=A0A0K3CQY6_RHOTO|nr:Proteophosphoglycan ppg4 [Rhodotorula toruloides ATCC 204091]